MMSPGITKLTAGILALGLLSACDSEIGTEVSRAAARSVVNDVIQDRFPGLPVAPITDCVIDNASGSEIVTIASSVGSAISDRTIGLIVDIARRPATLACITDRAAPQVIGRILLDIGA